MCKKMTTYLLLFFVIKSVISVPNEFEIKDIPGLPNIVKDFIKDNNIETIKIIEIDNLDKNVDTIMKPIKTIHKEIPNILGVERYYGNYNNQPMSPGRPQFDLPHHGHGPPQHGYGPPQHGHGPPPFSHPYGHQPPYYGPPHHHHHNENYYNHPPYHGSYGRPPQGYPSHHGYPQHNRPSYAGYPSHGYNYDYFEQSSYHHNQHQQFTPEPSTFKPEVKPTSNPEDYETTKPVVENNSESPVINKPNNEVNEKENPKNPSFEQTIIDIFGTPEPSTEYPLIDERFKPDQTPGPNANNESPPEVSNTVATLAPFQVSPLTPET